MTKERKEINALRRRLKEEYGDLFQAISAALFRHDPISINFKTNADEYEPEVGTILPRLQSCHSADAVRRVVHEEFVRWFSVEDAGHEERYDQIAEEIWDLWRKSNAGKPH
jgi:hypothetical protein